MTRSEQAQALRDSKEPHYNCCQSVLIPFCEVCGISEEAALRMGENFGSGMRHGGTCGAVSGALMALGLAGKGAPETKLFIKQFREAFGRTTCDELLAQNDGAGVPRKQGCDGMVVWAVEEVERLLDWHNQSHGQ